MEFEIPKQRQYLNIHFWAFQILACKMVVNFQIQHRHKQLNVSLGCQQLQMIPRGCLMYITEAVLRLLSLFSLEFAFLAVTTMRHPRQEAIVRVFPISYCSSKLTVKMWKIWQGNTEIFSTTASS